MESDFLSEKRILITGATRGIGFATASLFLERGAVVAVNGSMARSVSDACQRLEDLGDPIGIPGDLCDAEECRRVVEEAVERMSGLDILVNNAAVYRQGPMDSFGVEEWDRAINVNLRAPFLCTLAAIPALTKSKGSIVNVGSRAGIMGSYQSAVYCASKGGLVNMTRAISLELAPDIRVNCVCPGSTDTEMIRGPGEVLEFDDAGKRVAKPVEIARAIAFVASDQASYMNGAVLMVDGGRSAGW